MVISNIIVKLTNNIGNKLKYVIKRFILPEINTLSQAIMLPLIIPPECCVYCKFTKLYAHGVYYRKPNRGIIFNALIGLIPIKRFLCTKCRKTFHLLPECIAPFRWFSWKVQQHALDMFVNCNYTWKEISQTSGASITTCKRWIFEFQSNFELHYDVLSNMPGLNILVEQHNFISFWNKCLTQIDLQRAMLLLYKSDIAIP